MPHKPAPDGQVYVCCACGKRSKDVYGEHPIDKGWDESCALNCVLCKESHLVFDRRSRVCEVLDGGFVEEGE